MDPKQMSNKALVSDLENAAYTVGVKYGLDKEASPEYKECRKLEAQYRDEVMRRLDSLDGLTALRQQRDELLAGCRKALASTTSIQAMCDVLRATIIKVEDK